MKNLKLAIGLTLTSVLVIGTGWTLMEVRKCIRSIKIEFKEEDRF